MGWRAGTTGKTGALGELRGVKECGSGIDVLNGVLKREREREREMERERMRKIPIEI